MCGICGYITPGRKADQVVLKQMCDKMLHRGPDDEGFFIENETALAMRRLAIIDLFTGNQPIYNEDKNLVVVCNGEIYNFQELKQELENKGHRFSTRTDIEVIAHLYEEKGLELFNYLEGMFAIALFDRKKKQLILARDHFGKKPLCYSYKAGKYLAFSSEIPSLRHFGQISNEIDHTSLLRYLLFEYIPANGTIFEGIKKISPGSYLLYEDDCIKEKTYWQLEYHPQYETLSREEAISRLEYLLKEAVTKRLVSDVPLGAFLSGGIDSSLVVALMKQKKAEKVRTFTIAFTEKSFDECEHANLVADYLGTDHCVNYFSVNDFKSVLPKILELLGEPFGDASLLPTFLLSFVTRHHVKVALSGDASDEIFAGYPTYQAHLMARYFPRHLGRIIRPLINFLPTAYRNISFDFKLKRFFQALDYPLNERNQLWLGSFQPDQISRLLKEKPQTNEEMKETLFLPIYEQMKRFSGKGWLSQVLYQDIYFYLSQNMFFKVDTASMMNSLEVRCPFADRKLIDYVYSLPQHYKLNGLTTKYILKRLAINYLPKHIIQRKKKGFGIPVGYWLRKDLAGLAETVLLTERKGKCLF